MENTRGLARSAWMLLGKGAFFLAVALFLAEALWRGLGYHPPGSDIRSFARLHDAAMNDPAAVALAGSSRVRCGLRPDVLAREFPERHVAQLGILGNSGIPVLEDLANDAVFRGRVICEFYPAHWLTGSYPSAGRPDPLAYAHPQASGAYVEMWLGEHLREWFSFYSFNMVAELPRIVQHRPRPLPERPDRFLPYREISQEADDTQQALWLKAAEKSAAEMARTGPGNIPTMVPVWVRKIRARGGDVLFV